MLVINSRESPNRGNQVAVIIVPASGHCEVYHPLTIEEGYLILQGRLVLANTLDFYPVSIFFLEQSENSMSSQAAFSLVLDIWLLSLNVNHCYFQDHSIPRFPQKLKR